MVMRDNDDYRDSQVPVDDADLDDGFDAFDEPEGETGGSLRAKLVEALAKVAELEATNSEKTAQVDGREMDEAFAANGLVRDEGLGKAIALGYTGPADAQVLAEHLAAEYRYEYSGEPHPLADAIMLEQARLDQVSTTAGSVAHATPWKDDLAKAEASGDTQKTMAMKGQQVAGWFRP